MEMAQAPVGPENRRARAADKGLGDAPGFYVTCRLKDLAEARAEGRLMKPPVRKRKRPAARAKPKTAEPAAAQAEAAATRKATKAAGSRSPAKSQSKGQDKGKSSKPKSGKTD